MGRSRKAPVKSEPWPVWVPSDCGPHSESWLLMLNGAALACIATLSGTREWSWCTHGKLAGNEPDRQSAMNAARLASDAERAERRRRK